MAGNSPIRDSLILTRGADFVARYGVNASDPDIPAGTTARIEITATDSTTAPILATWAAVDVQPRFIDFRVEESETDEIPERYRYRLMVAIPDAPYTIDHCWYFGSITRKQ